MWNAGNATLPENKTVTTNAKSRTHQFCPYENKTVQLLVLFVKIPKVRHALLRIQAIKMKNQGQMEKNAHKVVWWPNVSGFTMGSNWSVRFLFKVEKPSCHALD
jgi:hypothetical protein